MTTESHFGFAECYAQRIPDEEKISAVRYIIKFLSLINKEKGKTFTRLWAYTRYMDDLIDAGENSEQTLELLRKEITFLNDLIENPGIKCEVGSMHELLSETLCDHPRRAEILGNLLDG